MNEVICVNGVIVSFGDNVPVVDSISYLIWIVELYHTAC